MHLAHVSAGMIFIYKNAMKNKKVSEKSLFKIRLYLYKDTNFYKIYKEF